MEPFKPSIDWGHAVADWLLWVANAWSISAFCAVVALALVRSLTPWGRQFWRITGKYFSGVRSIPTWLMLGVLLLSVIVGVRLNVLFSYQDNDLHSAVQVAFQGAAAGDETVKHSGIHGFWVSIGVFSLMSVLHVARVMQTSTSRSAS